MEQNIKFFFIRIGSNSEKNYIYKSVPFFNAIIAKASLFESSSGLLSSLFIKLNIQKKESSFIIDPNTYVFALNPQNPWSILSWVKCKRSDAFKKLKDNLRLSEGADISKSIQEIEKPKESDKDKVEIKTVKSSYRRLADKYFLKNISDQIGKRALIPDDFIDPDFVQDFVSKVISYQRNILFERFKDEKYKNLQIGILPPKFILSPYFPILNNDWRTTQNIIWEEFSKQYQEENSSLVLLTNKDYFNKNYTLLIEDLLKLSPKYVFFWISGFKEDTAKEDELVRYVDFIQTLSQNGKFIIDLYSGGFSTFLIPLGLAGITNGPGYGMDREIEPVQGGVPAAQYYIPTLHTRQQVLESYTLMHSNNIISKEDFHKKVCNCPICKTGIKATAAEMTTYFGELGKPKPDKNGNFRSYPSTLAMERCAFHFILARLIEFKWAISANEKDIISRIDSEISIWKKSNKHLLTWRNALSKFVKTDQAVINF